MPFQAWLYRIAHNLTANWHRDQGRRKIVSLEDYIASELIGDAPDRAVEDQEEIDRLRAVVRRLPEERQQLLTLKFVDGLSNAEIGDIMDAPRRDQVAVSPDVLALRMNSSPETAESRRKIISV